MNIHFSTDIIINGKPEAYNVIFERDAYHFNPASGSGEQFILKREDDEWHAEGTINDIAKTQAISALDKFLLSQH